MLRDMLQAAGFSGNVLSLLIVRCIFRMGSPLQLTFLNKMFLIYYAIDAIVGSTEIHFLFKLKEERYQEKLAFVSLIFFYKALSEVPIKFQPNSIVPCPLSLKMYI